MKVFIASSWKNQHAVEMLTAILREKGFDVYSWVERYYADTDPVFKEYKAAGIEVSLDDWINSEAGRRQHAANREGLKNADIVIYLSPAGKDSCLELGVASALEIPIYGLWTGKEDLGLEQLSVSIWFERYTELITHLLSKVQSL